MKRLIPIIQILTGTLLVILIVNDFVELLFEFVFDVEKLRAPIEWSAGGWKLKFWMIDHQPAFSLYQGFFMGTGFLLIFTALFRFLPNKVNLGIASGLVLSGIFVLLFPSAGYILEQTPRIFMWIQIFAGIPLVYAALNSQNNQLVRTVGLYIAAFILAILLIATLATSIVTLIYGILPIIGIIFLLLTHKRSSR